MLVVAVKRKEKLEKRKKGQIKSILGDITRADEWMDGGKEEIEKRIGRENGMRMTRESNLNTM